MKASSRDAIGEKNVAVPGAATTTSCLERKIVKRVIRYLIFAQSPPGRHPYDKCPVYTSHRSQIV
jgi:hypothetical protein